MNQPLINQVLKEPLTADELKKHWWDLGSCELGAVNDRWGYLNENCELLMLLQRRALSAINNRWNTIGKSSRWETKRKELAPERVIWCEVSLCVQLAEFAPDMKTRNRLAWRAGHKKKPGRKPSHPTDLISNWLDDIVNNYEHWAAEEERIGLSLVLHGKVNVYPSEIINAAKLLARVKETEEREQDVQSKALLTSIEEASAKLAQFGIGTGNKKEEAYWIQLLADAWDLEPNVISSVTKAMKKKGVGKK